MVGSRTRAGARTRRRMRRRRGTWLADVAAAGGGCRPVTAVARADGHGKGLRDALDFSHLALTIIHKSRASFRHPSVRGSALVCRSGARARRGPRRDRRARGEARKAGFTTRTSRGTVNGTVFPACAGGPPLHSQPNFVYAPCYAPCPGPRTLYTAYTPTRRPSRPSPTPSCDPPRGPLQSFFLTSSARAIPRIASEELIPP